MPLPHSFSSPILLKLQQNLRDFFDNSIAQSSGEYTPLNTGAVSSVKYSAASLGEPFLDNPVPEQRADSSGPSSRSAPAWFSDLTIGPEQSISGNIQPDLGDLMQVR